MDEELRGVRPLELKAAWAGCAEDEPGRGPERTDRFAHDAGAPLDVQATSSHDEGSLRVSTVTYARPAAVRRVLADRIGARTVVFEESAHNPQLQEPERFNRLLRDVWSRG